MYRNSGREKEENGPFESQERDGWTLFKMVWRKWMLEAAEK